MRRKIDVEVKAGIFLFFGLIVVMITILFMSGGDSIFQRNYTLFVVIPDATGLANGAAVRSGGLKVGRVGAITFSENYDSVKIPMLIDQKYKQRIHSDSMVKLQTQGVLGDKYLELSSGSSDKPIAENGATIEAEASKDLSSMLAEGEGVVELLKENLVNVKTITSALADHNNMQHVMKDLAETATNLRNFSQQIKNANAVSELNQTMKNIRLVSERVKNGEGTIGALFSDSSLYEDMKHLIGGASRNNVLKFFVRQAVKTSDDQEIQKEEAASKGNKKKAEKAKP